MTLALENPNALHDWIGKEIAVTGWLPVTQARIQQFADCIDDHQWIHLDTARALTDSPFRATIAHGFLTMSLLGQFLEQAVEIRSGVRMAINYGLNRVRFPSPVPAESKIRARFSVQRVTNIPGVTEVVFAIVVEGENSTKPCCIAEWIIRYYC